MFLIQNMRIADAYEMQLEMTRPMFLLTKEKCTSN